MNDSLIIDAHTTTTRGSLVEMPDTKPTGNGRYDYAARLGELEKRARDVARSIDKKVADRLNLNAAIAALRREAIELEEDMRPMRRRVAKGKS